MADISKYVFLKEWGDYRIYVSPAGKFCAAVADDDVLKDAETLEELEQKLDRHEKAVTAIKKEKIAIPMISESGEEYVITGLHASNGKILTSPAGGRAQYSTYSGYYGCPMVRDLVAKKRKLERDIDEIGTALAPFLVKTQPGDSYGMPVEQRLAELKANVEQWRALAVSVPANVSGGAQESTPEAKA